MKQNKTKNKKVEKETTADEMWMGGKNKEERKV